MPPPTFWKQEAFPNLILSISIVSWLSESPLESITRYFNFQVLIFEQFLFSPCFCFLIYKIGAKLVSATEVCLAWYLAGSKICKQSQPFLLDCLASAPAVGRGREAVSCWSQITMAWLRADLFMFPVLHSGDLTMVLSTWECLHHRHWSGTLSSPYPYQLLNIHQHTPGYKRVY